MLERIKLRLPEEDNGDLLTELCNTVTDRLCLRLKTEELPKSFESIAVDATVKMYRRIYYEGITSENEGSISNSFVDDVLAEYMSEIAAYTQSHTDRVVRFL